MKKVNYEEIRRRLRKGLSFYGSRMMAKFENGYYLVYSYKTLIFFIDPEGVFFYNGTRFSNTTSRQQFHIREALGINIKVRDKGIYCGRVVSRITEEGRIPMFDFYAKEVEKTRQSWEAILRNRGIEPYTDEDYYKIAYYC